MLEANIWQQYKDRGVFVFAITRQSYDIAKQWVATHGLTHPVLHDPPPLTSYYKYSHGYIPQNTLTDQDFRVIYDAIGYYESAVISAIQGALSDISVVLTPSSEQVVRGNYYDFNVTLKNWGNDTQTFKAWVDGILPDHSPVPGNPLLFPVNVKLAPGQQISKTVTLFVHGNAPAGDNYRVRVQVGSSLSDIWNCDLFELDILAD